jgi:porphobilinogen synthase
MTSKFPQTRLRRLRYHPRVRDLVRQTEFNVNDLVYPIFIRHGDGENTPITSMPGLYQIPLCNLATEIQEIVALKIPAVLLFGLPAFKDGLGSDAFNPDGIVQQAIRSIKNIAPELLVISDICCCEYTDHGHCGPIDDHTHHLDVNNDKTLEILQQQVISHAQAGTDMLAPSGSIDGMVGAIRTALDEHGFKHLPIFSYTIKYASSFYGPFREATQGAPKFGDRRTYQADPANSNEAIHEGLLDIQEGADFLMVKPGLPYLDVIYRLKQQFPYMPLGAYQVSGEYAMIKAAAMKGWLDEKRVILESLVALKRAGADIIISYFAKDVARFLKYDDFR